DKVSLWLAAAATAGGVEEEARAETRRGTRERLLIAGGGALSDAELLALVLDAGTETDADLDLAERMLRAAGGLARLDRLDRHACAPLGRLWPRRVALVRAALELGRPAAAQPPARSEARRVGEGR